MEAALPANGQRVLGAQRAPRERGRAAHPAAAQGSGARRAPRAPAGGRAAFRARSPRAGRRGDHQRRRGLGAVTRGLGQTIR